MRMADNANINQLCFEDIDFIGDKNTDYSAYDPKTGFDKGFSGRQVFNENGTKSTIANLMFKNCTFKSFRSVVRAQGDTDNINKITFDGCTFDGIGDQALVTTNGKANDMREVSYINCTFINVICVADIRKTKSGTCKINIDQSSFCYCPIEGSKNGIIRCSTFPAEVVISNSVFGPSLATLDGTDNKVLLYTAGGVGTSYLMNMSGSTPAVNNSYATKFDKWDMAANTSFLDQLTMLNSTETGIWQNPAQGDLKLVNAEGLQLAGWGIGANRWR